MAGSTLTAVDEHKLVLIGGYSPIYGFFDKVLEFDTESKQWTVLNITGSMPIGMFNFGTSENYYFKCIYCY